MATLTHAMLSDLHTGNASLSIKPYSSSGVDISTMTFASADQLFTLEDTFALSSDDPSSTDIRIDQHREVIDTSVQTGGNWVMTGNIPSIATELLDYFFTEGVASAVTGQDGTTYSGKGYLASPVEVEVSVLAESESKNTAILFPHVKMILNKPAKDDNSNPAYLTFTGYILPNNYTKTVESVATLVGDFAVLTATA